MRLLTRALAALGIVAVIATMVTLVAPKTAHALVATLVQVVNTASQPVLTGNVMDPYQQFAFTADCIDQGDCAIVFPQLTKEVLILHASCSFALGSTASVLPVIIHSERDNPQYTLQPFATTAVNGVTNYGVNAETYLFVAPDDYPRIDVFSFGAPVQNLFCTISGNNIIHN